MADNLTVMKSLEIDEVDLLKNASKASQTQNRLAEEFREMLIARECISSFDTYVDFMGKKDLVAAIRLCWRLGYDDKVKPSNLSSGLMSDFDFIQAMPKVLEERVTDRDELKRLMDKRAAELHKINRNIEGFIRNMGLIDVPPAKKRKATVSKVEMAGTIDQILSNATTNNPSAVVASANGSVMSEITKSSNASSLGKAMGKACISGEAVEEDTEKNMMDSDSEHEVDKNPKLKTLMKGVKDDCSVVVFRDTEGAIQTKKLTAKSTKIVKAAVTEEVTFWAYYWTETEEPMTEEEYQQHLEDGGDEAEVSYD